MKRSKQQIEEKFEKFCRTMGEKFLNGENLSANQAGFFLRHYDDSTVNRFRYIICRWNGTDEEDLMMVALTASQIWDWMDAATTAVEWYKNH